MKSWEVDKLYVVLARIADSLEGILKEMQAKEGDEAPKTQAEPLLTSDEDPFETEVYYVSMGQLAGMDQEERENNYQGRGEGWYYRPWSRTNQGFNGRPIKVRMAPVGPFVSKREADEAATIHALRLEDAYVRKLRGGAGDAD